MSKWKVDIYFIQEVQIARRTNREVSQCVEYEVIEPFGSKGGIGTGWLVLGTISISCESENTDTGEFMWSKKQITHSIKNR